MKGLRRLTEPKLKAKFQQKFTPRPEWAEAESEIFKSKLNDKIERATRLFEGFFTTKSPA